MEQSEKERIYSAIKSLKARALFVALYLQKRETNWLLDKENYGHRFSVYIGKIKDVCDCVKKKRSKTNKTQWIYWID